MKNWAIAASIVVGMALTGCATTVKPSYVSPTQYQALNCTQLQGEYDRIQHYLEQGVEPEKRTGVGVGVGVGGGFGRGGWGFGPTFSVNLGQSSNTKRSEIAQLLGQQDAIVQAAHFKNCRILTVKK
ncbi:hypothetical protein E0H77_10795 [Acinetobacter sp. ANC 4633]|uniref:hypothetical protein n=1 Tax=Acinetobacter sp. ANC 4633 TaxID=2529845 RepID=UPI00103A6019|nr:hypothetical protein [Acinetobacter sp. ANC 4633]TCB24810.1 hypothetical protein E0H77_10795 [Acinetobacter sp. ANC 4633]